MAKIGLFYGSTTGKTEEAAESIQSALGGASVIALHEIADASAEDFDNYDHLIIACPTWDIGGLQADWEGFYEDVLDNIDLDEDNQSELTDERIQTWTTQLKSEFAL